MFTFLFFGLPTGKGLSRQPTLFSSSQYIVQQSPILRQKKLIKFRINKKKRCLFIDKTIVAQPVKVVTILRFRAARNSLYIPDHRFPGRK
jgi:hypothetical protein